MPSATTFWPVQCAPSTCHRPTRTNSRLRCRPSSTVPPRLTVKCWPVSGQPRWSMWNFWIARANRRAASRLVAAVFAVAVWCTRIFTGRRLYTRSRPRFAPCAPPVAADDRGPVDRSGRVEAEASGQQPAAGQRETAEQDPAARHLTHAHPPASPDLRTDWPRTPVRHTGEARDNPKVGRPIEAACAGYRSVIQFLLPVGSQGRWRLWGTSAAICATSSSTSSRSSACRRVQPPRTSTPTPTPCATCSAELDRLATGPLAEGYADADRHPPVFDPVTHTVTVPEPVKRAYRLLWDGEWWRLGLPPELGGLGVPSTVAAGPRPS